MTALSVCAACSSKDDNKPSGNSSRTLQYQVTGNFSGSLYASYTTAGGGTANDPITLPWNKEITFASGVTAAAVVISGNGGVAGQQVTIVVKRGGSQISSTPATADASGSFSQAAAPVVF